MRGRHRLVILRRLVGRRLGRAVRRDESAAQACRDIAIGTIFFGNARRGTRRNVFVAQKRRGRGRPGSHATDA